MSEQTTPSLLEQLQAHHQAGYLSLHMPGHKENAALAPYLAQLGAEWDITELPGFDDLHAPEGILAKMMDRAAALWGSRKSCLLVNGSTGGLLAAMRGTTRRGDKILVARHCHKAIYHAIELCGLDPVFLTPATEPTFGLAGSISPEQVADALAQHPDVKLIVYPSPTYDGILSDTAGELGGHGVLPAGPCSEGGVDGDAAVLSRESLDGLLVSVVTGLAAPPAHGQGDGVRRQTGHGSCGGRSSGGSGGRTSVAGAAAGGQQAGSTHSARDLQKVTTRNCLAHFRSPPM